MVRVPQPTHTHQARGYLCPDLIQLECSSNFCINLRDLFVQVGDQFFESRVHACDHNRLLEQRVQLGAELRADTDERFAMRQALMQLSIDRW